MKQVDVNKFDQGAK